MKGCIYTPHEASFVALSLTYSRTCEILRTSKPKRTKTPLQYVCQTHLSPLETSGTGIDAIKLINISETQTENYYFLAKNLLFLEFTLLEVLPYKS